MIVSVWTPWFSHFTPLSGWACRKLWMPTESVEEERGTNFIVVYFLLLGSVFVISGSNEKTGLKVDSQLRFFFNKKYTKK